MDQIAKEIYRVLKPGGYLGILIGDTRIHKHYVPISHRVLQILHPTWKRIYIERESGEDPA
jgi:ubiquinone/menaquinone biosynthesis C-methylase UbiE